MAKKEMIKAREIVKKYHMGGREIVAVDNISFSIYEGEFVVILGPSIEEIRWALFFNFII